MKHISTLIIITILFFGCSGAVRTSISSQEKYYTFEENLSKSKTLVFEAVDEWIAVNATNSKNIVQLRDKEAGKLIVKPTMQVTVGMTKLPMNYILIIRISDEKIVLNFEISEMATSYGGYPPETSIEEIEKEFISIKNSIMNKIENY